MLTKEDFIRHILGEAPRTKARATKKDAGHVEGFDFADDIPDSEASEDTRFVTPLLQAGFGEGQKVPRATVIRSTDAVARYIPDEVRYWPKKSEDLHHTLLIETNLTRRDLLAIPAFKSRQLAHLDITEDALARLVAETLVGFQRGPEGLSSSLLKGNKHQTLCVVSIIDEREGHTGRLACFGTFNAKTEGLETFFLSEHTRTWDRADARERLGLIYERQFKKLGEASWQEAFTTTDERRQAENLLDVCTKKNVMASEVQEGILNLLDTIAHGYGLRKKPNVERRLRSFPLPGGHDIGIDAEERETKFGGINPFNGVTLRDDNSRLLGYIIYPLKEKSDAEKLRKYLAAHNRFHNVLVVYPDMNGAQVELWQGREQLTGMLRKGHSHKDAADVVNLLSRFFVVSKAKVRNPSELAQELAYRARYLQRLAFKQLADEQERGPLRELYNAFKVALVHDQKEDEFADAFAQTITYGLLTARWIGNEQITKTGERFTRQSAFKYLPAVSPFLHDLFKAALSVKLDDQRGRLLWLVDDVADLLDRIDVVYVFGEGDKGSDAATDPVIHFYEPFLAAYDKNLKNKRGVYFTPRPVVSYIVRRVHELLQTEFGLEDGLASRDTWGEVAQRIAGLKIPDGVVASDPFVCILDPATGTGTFLYECIEVIERTMKDRWCREINAESWSDERIGPRWIEYVQIHLLRRLYGFELMMASYAIAQMKLSFKLEETGYTLAGNKSLNIYLTNSLEGPSRGANPEHADLFSVLSTQTQTVDNIKRSLRFTVVIGNPPYAAFSSNMSDWVDSLLHGRRPDGGKTYNYYELDGVLLNERKLWLQDDYIKFIRLSQWILEQTTAGILGLITNNSFLDGPTHRGMRHQLSQFFQSLHLLNLHGSLKRHQDVAASNSDENVFDIQQGVSIFLGVHNSKPSTARYVTSSDVRGDRISKYTRLTHGDVEISNQITPSTPWYLLVPNNIVDLNEYTSFMSVRDIFRTKSTSVQTSRDAFVVDFDKSTVIQRVALLGEKNISEQQIRDDYRLKDGRNWSLAKARIDISQSPRWKESVIPYLYRVFDVRWLCYRDSLVNWPRHEVMDHLGPQNLALLVPRQLAGQEFRHAFVTRTICDMCVVSTATKEAVQAHPLFLKNGTDNLFEREVKSNFSDEFVERMSDTLSVPWDDSDLSGAAGTLSPLSCFQYIYAILFCGTYRSRYADFLKVDFPRIPITAHADLFCQLARLGAELISIHLLEAATAPDSSQCHWFGTAAVDRPVHSNDTVWIDRMCTTGFTGVPSEIWEFRLGGYQVCEKWLKDRNGRILSTDEIERYRSVIGAIGETIRIMKEIDEVIEKHGGWPDAFATKECAS